MVVMGCTPRPNGAQHSLGCARDKAAPLQREESSEVADDFADGVGARGSRQAVARMRAGTAEIKPTNRRFVTRPIENRPHGEELIERKLGVENVAAGKAINSFQIQRRDYLNGFDEARKIPSVGGERPGDGGTQLAAAHVPVPVL